MYSQNDEEHFILAATPEKGRFLDIGAWDPKTFSNTRALWERGWTGVMVEPSPEPFLNLLREYGNDPRLTLICAAAGLEHGSTLRFHATADGVSTSNEQQYARWRKAGGFYGLFTALIIGLDHLVTQFGPFDFVDIDAEGCSADLCLRFLRLPFGANAIGQPPACICVEHDGRAAEIEARARALGYRRLTLNPENLILAR